MSCERTLPATSRVWRILPRITEGEESMFFFEKKNQKTFALWHPSHASTWPAAAKEQKFFGSVFQKITPFFVFVARHVSCP
jgi:hypothetical protein